MKILLSLLLLVLAVKLNAQVPFANKTKFKDVTNTSYQQSVNKRKTSRVSFNSTNTMYTLVVGLPAPDAAATSAAADFNTEQKVIEEKTDLFDQFGGGLVISDDVNKLFPVINGEVINYRLNLWTKNSIRHYLPLSIISKVSGSTQNGTGTVNDATSFFGAPLTFRISPTLLDRSFGENRLVIGMHHDLRLVTIGDTATDKIESGFGYYGALGFTYFGLGDVSTEPETKYEGVWSFSTLLYVFKSGGKFNKAVFGDYNNKSLSGLELLLRFKPNKAEASKFNLLLGANYGFTKGAPNYSKWDFRIGIGN